MSAARLLEQFDRVAETPGAVLRLRRFILDLAVRGKLVEQDASDEPAATLVRQIRSIKARPSNNGLSRREADQEPLQSEDAPFQIPDSWAWIRIGDGFTYDAGIKRDPKDLLPSRWLLELEDIEKDTSNVVTRLKVSDRDSRSTKSEFQVGDILYGKLRPYLNKVVVADDAGYSTTEIVAIRPVVPLSSRYCAIAFRRPDFVRYVTELGRGTKMPRLRTHDAVAAPFPLPPLAEQSRIVAKVDELMALCDRLEAAQAERETRRDRVVAASLQRLNEPTKIPQFRKDVRFHVAHLTRLTMRVEQIRDLRQLVLNLAVRGRLVTQLSPPDRESPEPHQPDSFATDGGQVKEDPDAASQLPEAWTRVELGELLIGDSQNGYSKKPDDDPNGIPIFRISAGTARQDGIVAEEEHKLIGGVTAAHRSQFALKSGDLLACRFNGNRRFVGRLSEYQGYLGLDPIYPDKLIRLRLSPELALPALIRRFAESDLVRLEIEQRCATTVGNWGISATNLKRVVIPLPPLLEQHRIVAKVDELMAVCDRLEAQIVAGEDVSSRLLDALLHEALAEPSTRHLMEAR